MEKINLEFFAQNNSLYNLVTFIASIWVSNLKQMVFYFFGKKKEIFSQIYILLIYRQKKSCASDDISGLGLGD